MLAPPRLRWLHKVECLTSSTYSCASAAALQNGHHSACFDQSSRAQFVARGAPTGRGGTAGS